MTNTETRNKVDKLWTEFWTGGVTNPLTVIEQVSFLMFARLLDINETRNEKKSLRTGKPFRRVFPEDTEGQELRWQRFKNMPAKEMLAHVRDKVFPHFKTVAVEGAKFGEYMKDAQLLIQKETLLVSAVNMIDALPLTEGDTKGDLYEYLLSKLTTAGINGQFRTPRHIIRLMVEMLDPCLEHNEIIGDPACGTGGFLVETMHYLQRKYTSPEGIIEHDGEKVYSGDMLEPFREHVQSNLMHGFDFDVTMLRIAAMNLLLHGIEAPDIHYQDTLSSGFPDRFPRQAQNFFDVILANPPFKGSLDFEDVHSSLLAQVKTKKTELLFVGLILRMLKNGGRSATIVPDGVLFGSSKAHVALRETLVEKNQLEAVISLPSGVFRPYAGVSTGILIFTKGGSTKDVFFYDMKDDGFSLDDKRTQLYDTTFAGDLPDCLARWRRKDPKEDKDRGTNAFFVQASEIKKNNYDLSLNRYKQTVYEVVQFEPPREILKKLKALENDIVQDLDELEGML